MLCAFKGVVPTIENRIPMEPSKLFSFKASVQKIKVVMPFLLHASIKIPW